MNAPFPSEAAGKRVLPVEAIIAANDFCYEGIYEELMILESVVISAREAAWRGDRAILQIHLDQARTSLIAAREKSKNLRAIPVDFEIEQTTRDGEATE